jgi:hypothetical protein
MPAGAAIRSRSVNPLKIKRVLNLARLMLRLRPSGGLSARPPEEAMMKRYPRTLLREDTLLGICQAIGEDFGFNPLWLRMAFGVSLLASPTVVIGTYLGLGVLIAISRLLFPNPRRRPTEARSETVAAEPATVAAEPEKELAVAA